MATAQAAREIDRGVLEGWINMGGEQFESFVRNVCQWSIENGEDGESQVVKIPVNNDNEAKTTVTRENVKFDRMFPWSLPLPFEYVPISNISTFPEFARMIKRAYEQPA